MNSMLKLTATPYTKINTIGESTQPVRARKIAVMVVVQKIHLRGPIFISSSPTSGRPSPRTDLSV